MQTQQRRVAFVDCWGLVLPALGKPMPREVRNVSCEAGTTGAERKRRLNEKKLGGMRTERSSVAREMEMEVEQDGTNT